MAEEKAIQSGISFPYLRKFNGTMAALHFIQAMLMLVMGLTLDKIKDFKLPFTVSFLTYDTKIQSLVAKSLLAWLVFAGTLQPK
jgi:hypothetical protein